MAADWHLISFCHAGITANLDLLTPHPQIRNTKQSEFKRILTAGYPLQESSL